MEQHKIKTAALQLYQHRDIISCKMMLHCEVTFKDKALSLVTWKKARERKEAACERSGITSHGHDYIRLFKGHI